MSRLDRDDVLLAEAWPAESRPDISDRDTLQGRPAPSLHPEFAVRAWETTNRAPLVVTGAEVG